MDNNDYSKPHYLPTEGNRGVEALTGLAAALGYDRGSFGQLLDNNGNSISGLLSFFEDNPGAIGAVFEWVDDNFEAELAELAPEDDEEDECEDCDCGEDTCDCCNPNPGGIVDSQKSY